PESLYWQHNYYTERGESPPPGPPTFDRHTVTNVPLPRMPPAVYNRQTAQIVPPNDDPVWQKLKVDRRDFLLVLSFTGPMSDDEYAKLTSSAVATKQQFPE